jgi:hypothetical protein
MITPIFLEQMNDEVKNAKHTMFNRSVFNSATLLSHLDFANQNMAASQKEPLLWLQRSGHASVKSSQHLFALPRDGSKQKLLSKS